ncbi:hypothetical protein BGZ76_007548 [Entomortierella beljakovae]|nr:hypothetical protein BGZ76_007548 [Entomortierella beljakovae]
MTTWWNTLVWPLLSSKGWLNVRNHVNIVLNSASAPSGDAFLSLHCPPQYSVNEVHQYKYITSNAAVNIETYVNERQKAAKAQDIALPPYSGIVDRRHWNEYFGPYAERAFISLELGPININLADYPTLQMVQGIGPTRAQQILTARQSGQFINPEDAHARTGISRASLEQYSYE